jgi:hypothetical protein
MNVNQCSGGTYCLHPQGPRVSQATNQHEAGSKWNSLELVGLQVPSWPIWVLCFSTHGLLFLLPASCWFVAWLMLGPRGWKYYVPPKHRPTFTRLHGITTQKKELQHLKNNINFHMMISFTEWILQTWSPMMHWSYRHNENEKREWQNKEG